MPEEFVTRKEFEKLDRQVNGNGQPGIRQDVSEIREILSGIAATENERERTQALRHQENADKLAEMSTQIGRKTLLWTVAGLTVTGASLIVAILAIWVSIRLAHVSNLHEIINRGQNIPVYAFDSTTGQDAGSGIPVQP